MDISYDASMTQYTQTGLTLHQGGIYSTRVGAVNKAGFVAAFETDGVIIDTTSPIVSWSLFFMNFEMMYHVYKKKKLIKICRL